MRRIDCVRSRLLHILPGLPRWHNVNPSQRLFNNGGSAAWCTLHICTAMIHDQAMSQSLSGGRQPQHPCDHDDDLQIEGGVADDNRRASDRVPFPAEMILLWNHDASLRHRYRVLDASDGGFRIHSALPMLEGTTGMVIRVLACSIESAAQPVMVAWCRPLAVDDNGAGGTGYEIGLRLF